MRHAQHNFLGSLVGGFLDRKVQQRDQTFAALQRKAFCADKFSADEFLERHGVRQPRKNADLLVARELEAVARALHPFLQPASDGKIINVHELHADGPAIGIAQMVG